MNNNNTNNTPNNNKDDGTILKNFLEKTKTETFNKILPKAS